MIDDIVIDESEDFECVYVSRHMRYPFPVVTFVTRSSGMTAYFNSLATPFWGDAVRCAVKISAHYIVFIPQKLGNTAKISRVRGTAVVSATGLTGFIPPKVSYRAYPYKGGIAIKRFEPLQEDEE